ncbi:MAG TPA: glycosyltransferase family protein [Puia sp.]|nr:glycosyltransferase family protein [Puia sp.]
MKILYSVQATGNGHISRAMEILPFLKRYGQVDIFLSGANSSLPLDAPVKFRSKGLCIFYNNTGSLSYWEMAKQFSPLRIMKEVRDLPVEQYDLVLNDFECITSMACALKKVPSVNFGHQASFKSPKTPRPFKKDIMGEWILQHYARATQWLGLHFESYDDFILPPVVKKDILQADPVDLGHITVYLPSYSDRELEKHFLMLRESRFQVFSKEVTQSRQHGNIHFIPVNNQAFIKSLVQCKGIITGAGFETPAEALYLGKQLMVIPIKGQYEQACNAVALEKMGVRRLQTLDGQFVSEFQDWISSPKKITLSLSHSTEDIILFLIHHCTGKKHDLDFSPFARGLAQQHFA